jgi:hypothetical protein
MICRQHLRIGFAPLYSVAIIALKPYYKESGIFKLRFYLLEMLLIWGTGIKKKKRI